MQMEQIKHNLAAICQYQETIKDKEHSIKVLKADIAELKEKVRKLEQSNYNMLEIYPVDSISQPNLFNNGTNNSKTY